MTRKKVDPAADTEQVMTNQTVSGNQQDTSPPVVEERRPPRQNSEDILTLSDQERGFTPEDTEDVKWNYLRGATHRHQILTGVVSGIENTDSNNPVVAIDYEGIRILIPGHEMFMEDWPVGQAPPLNFRLRFGRILGATIDFVPSGVDLKNRAAVGSRREALVQRQMHYYASGRIKEGIRIACRVIDVSGKRLFVEALGVDAVIPASELTWEWFADISDLFSTGDIIVARVMDVQTDPESGQFKVRLSAKQAVENPDLANLRKLVPGSNYFGVVTNVQDRTIYLRLQAGVNAKTKTYRTKELPSKLDTVSFLVRSVDEEYGAAFGVITRIIKRHSRLR